MSKETIAAADRDPKCKQVGYADHMFDLGAIKPHLVVGSNDTNATHVGAIAGRMFLSVKPPEKHSKLWRLSTDFTDDAGNVISRIVDNELQVHDELFDFQQTGRRFEAHNAARESVLLLEIEPPNILHVRRGVFRVGPSSITIRETEVELESQKYRGIKIENCRITGLVAFTISKEGDIALASPTVPE